MVCFPRLTGRRNVLLIKAALRLEGDSILRRDSCITAAAETHRSV